jgi:hypothetical protein
MSEPAKPPKVHVDAEGWTVKTYADGTQTRSRQAGNALQLEVPESWYLLGIPQNVQDQDLAAAVEFGRQAAVRREKAFMDAFFGPGWDRKGREG